MSIKRRNDYDISFRKATKALPRIDRAERLNAANEMCEKYIEDHGEAPADYLLEAMADALLDEELTDPSVNKVSANEYPILSESQIKRRKNGGNTTRAKKVREVPYNPEEYSRHLDKYGDFIYSTTEPRSLKSEVSAEVKRYNEINKRQPVSVSYIEPSSVVVERKASAGRGDESRLWANAVKERDGYQCQHPQCSSRAGIMHAHHIHNYADWPELRFDTDNGITLCEPCHHEFHRIYGKTRTTGGNLQEFFGL